jgi:hypothetical protein
MIPFVAQALQIGLRVFIVRQVRSDAFIFHNAVLLGGWLGAFRQQIDQRASVL